MTGVYTALAAYNLTIVGGTGETVSLGGYVSGGGYGVLTPWLGLAVDQVLEVEVVLPNGRVVVGNACQNRDLFWAARGVSKFFIFHHSTLSQVFRLQGYSDLNTSK